MVSVAAWIVLGRDCQRTRSHKRCCHNRWGIGCGRNVHWAGCRRRNERWSDKRWGCHGHRSSGHQGYNCQRSGHHGIGYKNGDCHQVGRQGIARQDGGDWGGPSLVPDLHGYKPWREEGTKKKIDCKVWSKSRKMWAKGWSTYSENNYVAKKHPNSGPSTKTEQKREKSRMTKQSKRKKEKVIFRRFRDESWQKNVKKKKSGTVVNSVNSESFSEVALDR